MAIEGVKTLGAAYQGSNAESTVKTEHTAKTERMVKPEYTTKPEHTPKQERIVKPEYTTKQERIVKPEHTLKPERMNTAVLSSINESSAAKPYTQELSIDDGKDAAEGRAQSPTEALKKAVEEINKRVVNSEAIFGIHDATNRVTIKIINKETKEVLKEYPPEQTLDMIAKVWELAGLLVDEKR